MNQGWRQINIEIIFIRNEINVLFLIWITLI